MRLLLLISFLTLLSPLLRAQSDTSKPATSVSKPLFRDSSTVQLSGTDTVITKKADTSSVKVKPKHDPRKATFRSAVLPGWGQAYNHEYWKIPIVYGALAIPASLYIFNNNYYKWTKFAYEAQYVAQFGNENGVKDSTAYFQINKKVLSSISGRPLSLSDYQTYRNIYKRNKDYSLLWFIILWGVNVADATVFGHLKDFDVSDNLSMRVNPTYLPATKTTGVNLVFSFKKPAYKPQQPTF